ncbi:hypothetical protein D3C81_594600 [compost metagenome]
MEPNRQQPHQEPAKQGQQHRLLRRHLEIHAAQVEPSRRERDTGVQLAAEYQGNVVAEDIPQDPAKYPGDHPADRRHQHALPHLQRGHAANQGKGHQPQGIEHQEQRAQAAHHRRDENGQQRRTAGQHQVFRVLHPGQRVMPEQHVTHRAATQGGDAGNQHHAEPVHAAAAGRQRAGHGFGGDGDEVEHQQHGAGSVRACEKGAQSNQLPMAPKEGADTISAPFRLTP